MRGLPPDNAGHGSSALKTFKQPLAKLENRMYICRDNNLAWTVHLRDDGP